LFICGRKGFEEVRTTPPFGIHVLDGVNPITRIKDMYDSAGDIGTAGDIARYAMRPFNGDLYFIGKEGSYLPYNLWKMNPNTNAFNAITNVTTEPYFSSLSFTPLTLVASEINNRLYFVKTDLTNGGILSTDGTAAGTQVEARGHMSATANSTISVQTITEIPGTLFKFSNAIYFNANSFTMYRLFFSALNAPDFETSTMKLYPNPTANDLHFSLEKNLENATLKITSILGQTVLEKQNLSGNNLSLDVSHLPAGVFVLELLNGTEIYNTKFIKI
jgi:hypothetical protein